jgi:alanine racemase
MDEIYCPIHVEVDLVQFNRNILEIRKYIGNKKICLSIKANAYGHGIFEIAKEAANAKVDYLVVARIDEAVILREKNIDLPILVLSPFLKEEISTIIQYKIEPIIGSKKQLDDLLSYLISHNKRTKVHVKLDTGMNREGASVQEARDIISVVISHRNTDLISIYSHFVSSEKKDLELNFQQAALFESIFLPLKQTYPNILGHICNSGGLINFPSYHFDMVRTGFLAYGYIPKGLENEKLSLIKPCLSLKSQVRRIHLVEKGQGISYDHTYYTKKQTKIALIAAGYGDGYPFNLSKNTQVLIRGKRFEIVGRICMDFMMADIGDEEIEIGDEVVLIGKQKSEEIKVGELAEKLKTIIYEIICGFSIRVPIFYKR